MLRRIGRDRRFPPTARPWGIEFARKYSLDWAVDASLNVTLGTSPDLSLVGDLVAANDATATAGNPSVWVPADPNFGARSVIASRSERLDAGYGGLSGAAAASVLVVGRPLVNGYLLGSDNFAAGAGWALYHTGTTIVVYLDGTANYATYNCDGFDAAAYELQYDDSQAAWARLKVFRDGTELSPASTVGTCPTAFPTHSSIVLGGAAATLEINCTIAFAGAAARLVPGVAATAELAARFADSFWGESAGGYAVGRTVSKTVAGGWSNHLRMSRVALSGDCVLAAKTGATGMLGYAGLTEARPTHPTLYANDVRYAIYFRTSTPEIAALEYGVVVASLVAPIKTSARCEIRRVGSEVTYWVDAVKKHTSALAASGSYYGIAGINAGGSIVEVDFGATSDASWEDTHAATFGINAALYTADSAHVLEAADSYVERLASWVGNTPATRESGYLPPALNSAAFGGRGCLDFSESVTVTSPAMRLSSTQYSAISGGSQMTLAVVFELLATPGVGYVWAAGELKFIVQGTQLHFDTVNPVRVTANALAVGKNIAVFRFDGTQPVAADRHNLWLNNVLATTKSGAPAATLPALTDCTLGNSVSLDRQFEGYIAHQELSTSLLDPSALYTALAARYL